MVKEQPGPSPQSKPCQDKHPTAWRGQGSTVCYRSTKTPQLLAPRGIFSLSVSRSHRRRHLFLTCLCAIPWHCKQGPSALQSSVRTPPHCPWRVGGGQGGPSTLGCWLEMPKPPGASTQPVCPWQVKELVVISTITPEQLVPHPFQ